MTEERVEPGPQERADELEEQADRMERRSDQVEDHIDQARKDWRGKREDDAVPGAEPPPDEA